MLIKEIPVEERPRERLLKLGSSSLSNEELLDIYNILKEYQEFLESEKQGD